LSTYTGENTGRKCYGAEYHTGGGVVCTIVRWSWRITQYHRWRTRSKRY